METGQGNTCLVTLADGRLAKFHPVSGWLEPLPWLLLIAVPLPLIISATVDVARRHRRRSALVG
jgi:hypothetical protein